MTDIAKHTAENFDNWKNSEAIAEQMIALIGKLYREKNIILTVFGRTLVNRSVIEILKAHRRVRLIDGELSVTQTMPIIEALVARSDIGECRVDIGKVAKTIEKNGSDVATELDKMFADVAWNQAESKPTDVVLYGFGRIGRLMARLLIEQAGNGNGLRLKGIVTRKGADGDIHKRASLLRRDSVHGGFEGTITVDEENNAIIANGNVIQLIYASSPDQVDYTAYGINDALIIDNTGIWKDKEGLGLHLKSKGAKKVILTAPSKGEEIKNIVHGVNNDSITAEDTIISAASCTTNAITPMLKVLDDKYGIENGHLETIHAFTNDQNLIDNYHKSDRRGRSAVLNMVITSTGAAKAVAKALPQLKGKLSGNAVRVPTPNVSLAILNLNLKTAPKDVTELNEFARDISINSNLQSQIDYTNSTEVVSTDFVGTRAAGIYDAQAAKVHENSAVVYMWYDNEFGYSCQVFRIAQQMAGVDFVRLPKYDLQA